MTTSSLGFYFKVNAVPVTVDVPTRVNVKKRRERIKFTTLSNRDNINLSYLIGQELNPSDNLFISDKSTSLIQNRIPSSNVIYTETTSILNLSVDKFLVTNQFTTETPTKPEVPLFYVHTIQNYDPDDDTQTLLSLEFLDKNLSPILFSEYLLDSSTGELFNNIENEYNSSNSNYDVTYIRYTIKTVEGVNQSSIDIYHELIDNHPIYTLASFDDIDEFGNIVSGVNKYIIEEHIAGEYFEVRLPSVQTYAYKELPESRIKLLPPTAQNNTQPWNVRLTNGQFITSLRRISGGAYSNYKYRIVEFDSQTFNPFPPYKFQINEIAVWLNTSLIKVAKNIAYIPESQLYIDIIVYESDKTLKYAYSNNPTKIDTEFTSSVDYEDAIVSVDQKNGFIEVTGPIRDDDVCYVTYYTEEKQYEFTRVDFNPTNNLDILNQRVIIYVVPESVYSGSLDKSLHYLIINSLGKITYSSQAADGAGALDAATTKLLNEDFTTAGLPSHDFFYDIESSDNGLGSRVSGVLVDYLDEFSFVDKYTVDSVLLNSNEVLSGFEALNYRDNPRFLVLGDILVGPHQAPDALTTFDVRVRGGGLKKEYRVEALREQPRALWFWDENGGMTYPAGDAFMVEVPMSVLTENGGDFTEGQIREIINRHMGFGAYACIRYYDINPAIIDSDVTSGTITIEWPSYGSDITYNVYYSLDPEQNFVVFNTDELVDSSNGNSYTISGLIADTPYYLKVGAINDDIESFSQTVELETSPIVSD